MNTAQAECSPSARKQKRVGHPLWARKEKSAGRPGPSLGANNLPAGKAGASGTHDL